MLRTELKDGFQKAVARKKWTWTSFCMLLYVLGAQVTIGLGHKVKLQHSRQISECAVKWYFGVNKDCTDWKGMMEKNPSRRTYLAAFAYVNLNISKVKASSRHYFKHYK